MQAEVQSELARIVGLLQQPFWGRPDFWIAQIGTILGIAGLYYSVKAFKEAEKAKKEAEKAVIAAKQAGKAVKAQTAAMELFDVAQKLAHMEMDISFAEARDLLGDTTRRFVRVVAPFSEDPQLKDQIAVAKQILDTAQASLESVRPATAENEAEAPNSVYNGVESNFSKISYTVAELSGVFESQFYDRS